jgi:malonyl-CoA decarboxylase
MSEVPGSLLRNVIGSLAGFGRDLTQSRRAAQAHKPISRLTRLCRALLSEHGEASGQALAREVIAGYATLDASERSEFFLLLAQQFSPDPAQILAAARAYAADPTQAKLVQLQKLTESPRQELFRRLNMIVGGTAALVQMRKALLAENTPRGELVGVDADMMRLFSSWFSRGFLVLRRVDWHTPAVVLEKLIQYEAVHAIQGWSDLRRRLERDRRCFAFFHPALPDEPLIFVEVALTEVIPRRVQELIDPNAPLGNLQRASCATFYSITNCQEGLRGVSLGNFLIKQVVAELRTESPGLKTFVTLSPVPGFRRWLGDAREQLRGCKGGEGVLDSLLRLEDPGWTRKAEACRELQSALMPLCAWYLTQAKAHDLPLDLVARFHINNGARLEAVNWLADLSDNGLQQSAGIMVNYRYRPEHIERNQDTFAREHSVLAARRVRALARFAPLAAAETGAK